MLATQPALIRLLKADEAGPVVDAVFGGLSPESRRLRFHVPMPRLPGYARDRLTKVDGWSHVALAAWVAGSPVGVGRVMRLSADRAEVSMAVVDAWQGRGIGRSMLARLTSVSARLGYRQLHAEVLAENAVMLHLLRETFPDAVQTRGRGVIEVVCPTSPANAWPMARLPLQRVGSAR